MALEGPAATMPRRSDWDLLRRLARRLRPHARLLGLMLAVDLVLVPVALLAPIPLKIAVDCAVLGASLPPPLSVFSPSGGAGADAAARALLVAVGMVLAIALLRSLADMGSAWLHALAGERLVFGLREELFRHSQRLSLAYHDTQGTANTVFRIHWDVPSVQHIAVDGMAPLLVAVFTLAGMIAVTAAIDWQLAAIALAVVPLLFLHVRRYRRPLRQHWSEARKGDASAVHVVQETLAALRVVRAFGREDHEHERFVRTAGEGMRARLRFALVQGRFELLIGLTTALGTVAVLWVGVRHVHAGSLTLGNLLVVMAYLAMLYSPLRTISSKSADVQASLSCLDRALALLEAPQDVVEMPRARPVARVAGDIVLENVSYAYQPGRQALHDISVVIPAGSCVGVEGPTGAGKSTLVSLLPRFVDPTAGRVLLDGEDVRNLRLADLRAQFAIVLQEPVLFSRSIAENIAYGRPGASRDEIVAAARAANVHDFVCALPDGYDTRVGERGAGLSGGERQRIALARAFLKDAPILILDEPTSAVDIRTENDIVEAVRRLAQRRTTFLISHRPSTLACCDLRLVLEAGRLAGRRRLAAGGLASSAGGPT